MRVVVVVVGSPSNELSGDVLTGERTHAGADFLARNQPGLVRIHWIGTAPENDGLFTSISLGGGGEKSCATTVLYDDRAVR